MAFPMIETGYKPEFSLGALYQGENAAAAQNMQTQEIIQQALANIQKQANFPLEQDKLRATTDFMNAQAENMRREKNDPNKLIQQALGNQALDRSVLTPILEQWQEREKAQDPQGMADVYHQQFTNILPYLKDERVRKLLESSKDPMGTLKSLVPSMNLFKEQAGIEKANIGADAKRNVAEMQVWMAKYKADMAERIAQIKSLAGDKAQALSTDKVVASLIQKDLAEGKINHEQAVNFLSEYKAANTMSKPTSGIAPVVKPGGKVAIENKPEPSAPKYPSSKPPVTPQEESEHTLESLRKVYPGKTDDELRTAYKKKFNKELK